MTILNSAEQMKHNKPPLNKSSDTNWQILGELELPIGSNLDNTIKARLMEILNPLNLHAGFLNKILKSAQDAAGRVMQNGMEFEHIHILIFVPLDYASKGHTWGFFRIEKIESATTDNRHPDHVIEFYLYFEG